MVPDITLKQDGCDRSLVALPLLLRTCIGLWTHRVRHITLLLISCFLIVFVVSHILTPSATASPDKTKNKANNELLFSAVRENNLRKVKLAFKKGADINARTEFGETVLHFVQDSDIAKLIIEKGADVHIRENSFKMTPIFFQSVAIARLLHKAGADINIKAEKGITPLMWYTYSNYLEGVKFLVTNGAHLNSVNSEGSTALDIASRFDHRELTEYLKTMGAKTATQ